MQIVDRTDNMWHNDAAGPETVGVHMADITAAGIQETMDLALRVVKSTSARPAIGSAEYGRIAVLGAYAVQLIGDQIERLVPFDLNESLTSAQMRRGAGTAVQP